MFMHRRGLFWKNFQFKDIIWLLLHWPRCLRGSQHKFIARYRRTGCFTELIFRMYSHQPASYLHHVSQSAACQGMHSCLVCNMYSPLISLCDRLLLTWPFLWLWLHVSKTVCPSLNTWPYRDEILSSEVTQIRHCGCRLKTLTVN